MKGFFMSLISNFLCFILAFGGNEPVTEIFVHPFTGNNSNPGTQEAPLLDFTSALAKAQPGDIIRMMPVDVPVRGYFRVADVSGTVQKPIIIDGGFNTYIGSVPVDLSKWTMVDPGLYKSVKSVAASMLTRYYMCFNGRMNRMGQPGKWTAAPLKPVADLNDYEWTIINGTDFYFRIPAHMTPAECEVEEPSLSNGVQLTGEASNLVFRNIIAKNYWNDGFNIHGNCREIRFENIAALYNGDDGISAHGTCQITVSNYISVGNSTGICHVNESECAHENVYISGTTGRDLYLLNRKNEIRNLGMDGIALGGIDITTDSADPLAVRETFLDNCFFFSPASGARRVLNSKNQIFADQVSSFNYQPVTLPAGWVDTEDPETLRQNISAIKEQLFAIFGSRLKLQSAPVISLPELVEVINPGNPADTTGFGAVDYTYSISATAITIEEWKRFYEDTGSGKIGVFDTKYNRWNDGIRTVGPNAPAVYLTIHHAAQYCNWLTTGSATEGAYMIDSYGRVIAIDRSYRNSRGLLYVLPSEDEWYKAAFFKPDGSGYSLYATGSDAVPPQGGADGWNYGNFTVDPNRAWAVDYGGLEQNGTRNMMGNIYEWMEDTNGMARGGSYQNAVTTMSKPSRYSTISPTTTYSVVGFRIVEINQTAWPKTVYPFDADPYTLLLAGFEENTGSADYAMGLADFGGMGWLSGEGYYGAGLNLDRTFLHPDFYSSSDSALPFFFNFGISPHGNFENSQGTLEFWFLLKDDTEGVLFHSDNGNYGVSCRMSPSRLILSWSGLGEEKISGQATFSPALQKNSWHYFTQTWSPGEFAIYIDGRLAFTRDMSRVSGLVSSRVDKPGIYIGGQSFGSPASGPSVGVRMGLDELAVSSVVRYIDNFEPKWKDGVRPSYAYAGPGVRPIRYDRRDEIPAVAESVLSEFSGGVTAVTLADGLSAGLDSADGFLKTVSAGGQNFSGEKGGVLIWEGLDRTPLFHAVSALDISSGGSGVSFRQQYGDDLIASSSITQIEGRGVWELVLKNTSAAARHLEVQLSLPLPLNNITDYFDGSVFHDDLRLPRRKTEFAKTVPFSAAGNAGAYAGIGLDSEIRVSDLINEWVPLKEGRGAVRQGFKTVIDPGAEMTYRFFILHGNSRYGARKALEQYYHAHEGPLYTKNPDVSVLTHLPCAYVISHANRKEFPYGSETARMLYCGHDWRHEPNYGIKGDEAGLGPYFKNEAYLDQPDYEYAVTKWDKYTDLDDYRRQQLDAARSSYEQTYTAHVRHWHPQTLNKLIINDVYPAGQDLTGDPLQCGQKYSEQAIRALMVNTFNTPLFDWNKQQADYFEAIWGPWNKGFTHDTTYDCTFRAIDPIARQTAGRSFSRDRGEFLRMAFGFGQWFQYLNKNLQTGDRALAALGDGSYVSYITSTAADKNLTEEMRMNDNMGYPGRFSLGRIVSGEKAFDAPIGRLFSMDRSYTLLGDSFMNLTEPELRNYYRYFLDQYMLHCFKHGVYMSALLTHGKQKQVEHRALLVESVMAGYKVVTAASTDGDLFVTRYGSGLDTILVAGNQKPVAQTVDLTVDGGEITGGAALVVGDYYGGTLGATVDGTQTVLGDIEVGRRDLRAFRAVGALYGAENVSALIDYSGDGITFKTAITFNGGTGSLGYVPFLPADYSIESIFQNGNPLVPDVNGMVAFPAGTTSLLEVNYRHNLLNMDSTAWSQAELIKTNAALVQAVIPAGATAVDSGTLQWINHFVFMHDYEDGVKGNLTPVAVATNTSSFSGWQVTMNMDSGSEASVSLSGQKIVVSGRDDLERKRGMAVFMRLLDRKYPHIGSFLFPDDLSPYEGLAALIDRNVAQLIEAYDFHKKPLLDDAHEHLYQNGNMDFHGKYTLKVSPYIYEPGNWR